MAGPIEKGIFKVLERIDGTDKDASFSSISSPFQV